MNVSGPLLTSDPILQSQPLQNPTDGAPTKTSIPTGTNSTNSKPQGTIHFSADGTPRIKIPDSVFQKGADLHQDFILRVFLGKTPAYAHIQSVLTHIWGRGLKLEIHLRPESRSMLVRIPNSTIRKKIVDQEFWHIGNVLFYVAQWSASVATQPPSFTAIWSYYAARLRIPQTSNSWADVTHSLMSLTGTKDHIYLSILSWQATVYEVWWERNERLHRGKFRSVDMVVKKINGLIKNKISSLRPESNRRASSLMQIWFSIIDGSS
ncbi:hypothetical protein F2Q69_00005279 [Brassica cretica]|uniref:DUF4283 domain-containing protein n=1 Tax=Brassica cretica TaxID=69181 RepID=A0A8S9P587_BRACR|nr:hypothetical protein F2Q69_00005279 [Brassica cretica]